MGHTRRRMMASAGVVGLGLFSGCTGGNDGGPLSSSGSDSSQGTGFFHPNPLETDIEGFLASYISTHYLPAVESAVGESTVLRGHGIYNQYRDILQMDEVNQLIDYTASNQFLIVEGEYDQEEAKQKVRSEFGNTLNIDMEYNGYQLIGAGNNRDTFVWACGPDDVGWLICEGGQRDVVETEMKAAIDAERGDISSVMDTGGSSRVLSSADNLLSQSFTIIPTETRQDLVSRGSQVFEESQTEAKLRNVFYLLEDPEASEEELGEEIRPGSLVDQFEDVESEDISVNKDGRVWRSEVTFPIEFLAESTE